MNSLHSSRIVDLTTNCYVYYVLQMALDCKEEEDCLLIMSELLQDSPATTLVNKYASYVSHVWSTARAIFILSNLYSSSALSFVLSFDPLSVSTLTLVPSIHLDPSLPSS
jgi:hypothetical protein